MERSKGMSREILFRGKRIDNKWVEGNYASDCVEDKEKAYIICGIETDSPDGENASLYALGWYEADPSTVCRYTGLNDEHGNKIFEGDICTVAGEDGYFVVEWDKDEARFILFGEDLVVNFSNFRGNDCEIVGNVSDNPELAKGGHRWRKVKLWI